MAIRLQVRNGLASEWQSFNPILMEGELAVELDTRKFKIGNGIDAWNTLPYATQGESGKNIEINWNGTQLGTRVEGETIYNYTDLKGEKGDTGYNLQFNWNGTRLGVRREGEITYNYVELKGEKGDPGSIDNLNATVIQTALGYTPFDENSFIDTTYSEISEAEIDTGTASTLRTITARRLKFIIDKIQNIINALTKADIGLGNVDNLKQMPISGGMLENYTEKLITTTGAISLNEGNVFYRNATADTTFTITNVVDNDSHSFTLIVDIGETVRTLTFPASVKWQGGEIPDMTTANKTYVLTFLSINGGTTWFGNGSDY